MQCQKEGCKNTAVYGAQILSAAGYRVGLCTDCAKNEAAAIDLPMDPPFLIPIEECEWWPGLNIRAGRQAKTSLKR